uniref:Uncharacterized protein n=1 Tax=Anguilla anguilla TaxID=7936 RepID=A0A0E9XLM9_ANGAN
MQYAFSSYRFMNSGVPMSYPLLLFVEIMFPSSHFEPVGASPLDER